MAGFSSYEAVAPGISKLDAAIMSALWSRYADDYGSLTSVEIARTVEDVIDPAEVPRNRLPHDVVIAHLHDLVAVRGLALVSVPYGEDARYRPRTHARQLESLNA